MADKILDPDYQDDYYPNIYWHGTTVGWLAKDGLRVGMNQFGETASPQSFIWLHANQRSARNQAGTSIGMHESRIKAGTDDPFWGAPHIAAKYVYRVEIRPFATKLDMWEQHLQPEKLKKVLQAISKTSFQVEPFRWLITSPIAGVGRLHGLLGTRPRDKLLAEPNGWFKWLCRELGFGRLDGQDNEHWRRLALFCKNADIDVIKNPKASYHLNGCQLHNDADNAAEWAIMNLQRTVKDASTGKIEFKPTYKIIGAYAIWPQQLLPAALPPKRKE